MWGLGCEGLGIQGLGSLLLRFSSPGVRDWSVSGG